jgi:acetylornithine deacetylase/succinyl-diaminopimelate desuccinylase-like protein
MNYTNQELISMISADRLRQLTLELVKVPSPTGDEGAAIDFFARVLRDMGLQVEIVPDELYPKSPSLVARLRGKQPGRTLQFDGHIDTIHLPHGEPYDAEGRIYGRGAADMKGSLAAAAEALRVLKTAGIPLQGDVLLTAHGMHEAPWAYGETLYRLIQKGHVGSAVIVMEGSSHEVAVIGKGAGIFQVDITWKSDVVHQGLFGRIGVSPAVQAGVRLVQAFVEKNAELARVDIPYVGPEIYFVGILRAGDFYNRIPTRCYMEGVRRYGPDHAFPQIEAEFHSIVDQVAAETGASMQARITFDRDAFRIDPQTPVVGALQAAYREVFGKPLPLGGMMSCADAPPFVAAGIPATYYAPNQERAHADLEYAFLDSLVETSKVYLLAAVNYLGRA